MTGTQYVAPPRFARRPRAGARWRWGDRPWPAAVAVAFTVAQLVLVRPTLGLGWDETVYVSQVSGHAPAAFFSAPRARGVPLLVAPITLWSSSTTLLRVYLALLSGLGLYLALRAWRGLFRVRVLASAGALFASLWVTLFYGPQAMPNLWVALAALAAVGCFLRAQEDRTRWAPVAGLAASAALMALMRPTDAAWVSLPLLVALLAVRRWRYRRLLLALVAGLVAGAGEWVVEAYVSYGGLAQRLSDASRIEGGLGWHNAVGDQLRSLGGRTLCRPCTGAMPHTAVTLWWFALPLLAVAGLLVAVRARRAAPVVLPGACAVSAAVPYLFMIGYAAPRFLLPAYALLSLPVAVALVHLVTAAHGRARVLVVTAVAIGLLGHLAIQAVVLGRVVDRAGTSHERWARIAEDLHREGVRPPCLITGSVASAPPIPIAFYAGCASADTGGHNANTTAAALSRTARSEPVAVLTADGGRPPSYARTWHPVHLTGRVDAYLAPGGLTRPDA
ncbi:hypothetical protein ACIRPX_33875 [Streptomyces sp. NPDC101225]|uniref:hypothetical protein n=1 Tax=Streptomyces sp. NPDC101225 TaxID=3366135 RepID=UPI0038301C17